MNLEYLAMKTNKDKLVQLSVWGEVLSAVWPAERIYRIGGDGKCRVLPGTGGICYSHQIGDNAIDLQGDHVEPGVSIKAPKSDDNSALNTFACVGNDAVVISGSAKGSVGTVVGTHGGVEHVMIDFPQKVLEQLVIGDKIQVRAHGTGLELSGCADVVVMNSDPRLIDAWELKMIRGDLHVPVTHTVPAGLMGSGLGAVSVYRGDYDIQMFSPDLVDKYKLDSLRFGDIVAIIDADHTFGRRQLTGAVSVGVIVHSKSDMSGHGPGVASLLSSAGGRIKPVIDSGANVGAYLKLGRWRKGEKKSR